jgi:hypothetical protein
MTTGQKAVTAVLRQQTLTLQAQGETTVIPMSDIVRLLSVPRSLRAQRVSL